jgi:hypothetical protein
MCNHSAAIGSIHAGWHWKAFLDQYSFNDTWIHPWYRSCCLGCCEEQVKNLDHIAWPSKSAAPEAGAAIRLPQELIVFDSGVDGLTLTVRRIAGVIDKRTFFFARRALFGRGLGLKLITAFITNPGGHGSSFDHYSVLPDKCSVLPDK